MRRVCNDSNMYPKNLLNTDHLQYELDALHRILGKQASTLFSGVVNINVWERLLPSQMTGREVDIHNASELRQHFGFNSGVVQSQPLTRFMCVFGTSSADIR